MNVSSTRNPKVQPRHVAASALCEVVKPRTWDEWLGGAADAIGLIPGLNVPAEIVSGGLSLYRGDVIGFGLSLAGMIPVAGEWATAVKLARRARKAVDTADTTVRIAHRARKIAAAAHRRQSRPTTSLPRQHAPQHAGTVKEYERRRKVHAGAIV